jgi:hypothetical protein
LMPRSSIIAFTSSERGGISAAGHLSSQSPESTTAGSQ